jgi:hypothetical protein
MKHIAAFLKLAVVLLLVGFSATPSVAKPPVYVFLHARITDHVNIELSEDRLRRVLPMLERYRKENPEAHVSATILLTGAISQALADRNGKTGIKDFVLDYARRGVIELGYDGTDEPTYKMRATPDAAQAKTAEERWMTRGSAAERFMTESGDPLTGFPLGGTGGLKKMQEIFGEALCITGVTDETGGDSEVVQHLGRYNTKAIMFGIPEDNPTHILGYEGSAMAFGELMSPIPESSPELYWQDNILRSSEISDYSVRVVHGDEGPNAIKTVLSKLDRSKIHIIHVELGSERMYVRPGPIYPPSRRAYDDMEDPRLPATALRDADDVQAAYAKEDGLMKWLVTEFFPTNGGSRFLSSTDLKQMTPSSTGYSLSMSGLRAGLTGLVKDWGNDTILSSYLYAEGHYLSMADLFLVMTDALTELHHTGKLPQSVRVSKIYGPIETPDDHGPALGEVTAASVARVSAGIADRLHDDSWNSVPKNVIPARVTIDGMNLTASQFLRLMAEALVAPSMETKLSVKMTYMSTRATNLYPKRRRPTDLGATWTFKPAPLDADQTLRSER